MDYRQSSIRECRQRMKDDSIAEGEFEMGLNSDQTFVGKDRTLPVLGNQLLSFRMSLSAALGLSLSQQSWPCRKDLSQQAGGAYLRRPACRWALG